MQPPPIGRELFRRSPKEPSTPPAMIPSATQVPLPNLPQQTFGRLFYEIQRVLEHFGAAVVGVGDLGLGTWRVVEKRTYLGPTIAEPRDRPIVLLVHRRDREGGSSGWRCLYREPARSPAPAGQAVPLRDRSRGCLLSPPV